MKEDIEIRLPKLGESILSASIVQWFKQVGDFVALDEALLEVSTDKVNSEIPSPVGGILKAILAQPGDELDVGAALAIVAPSDAVVKETPKMAQEVKEATQSNQALMDDYFSPAVIQLAKQEKIPFSELEKMHGTGAGGRITKKDIENYAMQRSGVKPSDIAAPIPQPCPHSPRTTKMTGMRKAIADVMTKSHKEIPHAAVVQEIDVTDALKVINEQKEAFLTQHGVKLTITSFMIKALATAAVQFPHLNSSIVGDDIVEKSSVNIGIAVALEKDGVLVPVIRDAQRLSIPEIAKQVTDLSKRARSGALTREDVDSGTMTLTNFGMAGAVMGFPIIRPPEVAIIGTGSIKKQVVVSKDDTMSIRSMMHVTLSFDHRVVDGLYGCAFLNVFKQELEDLKF
ncbi:MAG: 2-oxo acid dehydrogenase subunit E2 [Parachlamydiales bacterium]|nr:2-oxo acid dehydrogenase subunit E2 [Parachlamydiales bacterium]